MEYSEPQIGARLNLWLEGFIPHWAKGLLFCGGSMDMDLININEDIGVNGTLHQFPSQSDIVTALEIRRPQVHRLDQFHF